MSITLKTQHPWQRGPAELIAFAIERMHKGSDFDRRLAFLILDVGIETLFKTFLNLPDGVMDFRKERYERSKASKGNFHTLLKATQEAIPEKAIKFDFAHIEHFHGIRNTLYHQGNQVSTVSNKDLVDYAVLATELLHEYLDVDLSEYLVPPELPISPGDDQVVDSVEAELLTGRYRFERLKSNSIRVYHYDTNKQITPVKPILREVIQEKSLSIDLKFKSGKDKNTRTLGREIIKELKPSAWHGWVDGQKVSRDSLVTALTGRILEGKADQKNWETVDFIRNLDHDTLVFTPTGKGIGNSPFNLNCWRTENGNPIK